MICFRIDHNKNENETVQDHKFFLYLLHETFFFHSFYPFVLSIYHTLKKYENYILESFSGSYKETFVREGCIFLQKI